MYYNYSALRRALDADIWIVSCPDPTPRERVGSGDETSIWKCIDGILINKHLMDNPFKLVSIIM